MSTTRPIRRITVPDIAQKKSGDKIVVLTAYTAPFATILDPHVDILLVGDSLGMVLYGMESTLPVSLDIMINHGKAVVKGSSRALVVVDMPFGSYQASKEDAFRASARIMQETGAGAVKLEGGAEMAETIAYLTERAIPVMGHVGLKPQHVHVMGGYRYQGRSDAEHQKILADAKTVEKAGAFSIVLEGVDSKTGAAVTKQSGIPTIGIGAGLDCDGQVLVTEDLAGLFESAPKFVRKFGDLRGELERAVKDYAAAVRGKTFPSKTESYGE